MRVLLVDALKGPQSPLVACLTAAGFAVDVAASLDDARGLLESFPYQVAVPVEYADAKLDATRLILEAREQGLPSAFLVVCSRPSLARTLALFEAGADDVAPGSCDARELVARVRAVSRRAPGGTPSVTVRGDLRINWTARDVRLNGQPVRLTAKEFGILELLATHPGRLFDRDEIIARVWNATFLAENNVVDVYVWNLRKKLGGTVIETVRGVGYRFPPQ